MLTIREADDHGEVGRATQAHTPKASSSRGSAVVGSGADA